MRVALRISCTKPLRGQGCRCDTEPFSRKKRDRLNADQRLVRRHRDRAQGAEQNNIAEEANLLGESLERRRKTDLQHTLERSPDVARLAKPERRSSSYQQHKEHRALKRHGDDRCYRGATGAHFGRA